MADSSSPYISHHPPTMTPQAALTARNSTRTSTSTTSTSSSNKPDKVDIFVGGQRGEHFVIDFALLQGRSPMLEYALSEYGGVLQLPEEDAGVFHDYLKCLKYGAGRVKVKVDVGECGKEGGGAGERGDVDVDVFAGLPDVWIMADKLEDLCTANEIVDEIQRRHTTSGRFPGAGSIDTVFAETTTYSPLRRLIIDLFVLEASPREYEHLKAQGVTSELWFAVAHEMRGLVEEIAWGPGRFDDALGKRVEERPRCDYHLFDSMGCASCSRGRVALVRK